MLLKLIKPEMGDAETYLSTLHNRLAKYTKQAAVHASAQAHGLLKEQPNGSDLRWRSFTELVTLNSRPVQGLQIEA